MIDKTELNAHIKAYQETKVFSDQLVSMLLEVFKGVLLRYGQQQRNLWEDIQQDLWVWFITNAHHLDTDQDPFCYITSSVINVIRMKQRAHKTTDSLNTLKEAGFDAPDPRPFMPLTFPFMLGTKPLAVAPIAPVAPVAPPPKRKVAPVAPVAPIAPAVRWRLNNGWDLQRALTTPIAISSHTKYIEYNGKSQSILEWAAELGINQSTLKTRLLRGWSLERAFNTIPNVSAQGQHTPGNNPSPDNPVATSSQQSGFDPNPPLDQRPIPPDCSKIGYDPLQEQEGRRRDDPSKSRLSQCA